MATAASHNKNSSAVKRILKEARELAEDDSTEYTAAPLETDIFEWHATIRGPADTEFEGGLYHARINLPSEYPFKAPSVMVMTPNGRFELNKKLCISFTSYHEELWQPAWGVRTAIVGLQGFFPAKGEAAMGVGILEFPQAERKKLAVLSRDWVCPDCKVTNVELLPDPAPAVESSTSAADLETKQTREAEDSNESPTSDLPASPSEGSHSSNDKQNIIDADTDDSTPRPKHSPLPLHDLPPSHTDQIPLTSSPPSATDPQPPLQPPPIATPVTQRLYPEEAVRANRESIRAPLWMDGAILLVALMIAMFAGKRLVNLWDYMLKDKEMLGL